MIEEVCKAAQAGDASRLSALLEANPQLANEENGDGLLPLGIAAHCGRVDVVRTLLDRGADVNALSCSAISIIPSNTALHAAIAGARDREVIQLLLERGANPALLDSNGHTCLHVAVLHDDGIELIRLLLDHGADANARAEGGDTALSLALAQGHRHTAEFLRRNGAKA
ncbi:ankyrin repeat domain-containing protein [Paenibacillus dendritiformis]|uniref:Ankyrin n=1 Tax=Paenibacillus dendritiformis C454 TaxID=1131935 RepID=H3SLV0_9BACL|nr:ankyrin repeat domain-containing protein [Paenibacillus dendritiformis]EHQ59938.1 ankyrin [Paenibacillus dendritiformis C454]CAH8772651.1 ankyrin repeat domain-containing protein [Paenibacillus dendritiformis]